MKTGSASKSRFEKEPRAGEPGAKWGIESAAGNSPRGNNWQSSVSNARDSITSKFHGLNANNFRDGHPQNIHGNGHNNFRGEHTRIPCFELNTNDWNGLCAQAFRDFMRQEDITIKELARLIGCNDRTAENYVSGRNSPRDLHFLRALAVIPTFEALVRKVAALAGEVDPMQVYRASKLAQAASHFLSAMGAISEPPADFAADDRDLLTPDLFGGIH